MLKTLIRLTKRKTLKVIAIAVLILLCIGFLIEAIIANIMVLTSTPRCFCPSSTAVSQQDYEAKDDEKRASRLYEIPPWISHVKTGSLFIYTEDAQYKRLGNQLFNYASLFGVAWRNGLTPIWPAFDTDVSQYFNISMQIDQNHSIIENPLSKFVIVSEHFSMTYELSTEYLPVDVNVTLSYYLQSWKYFRDVEQALRRELVFKPDILAAATAFLEATTPAKWRRLRENVGVNGKKKWDLLRIVIHVRRTDLISEELQREGWALPHPEYFNTSMKFFQSWSTKVVQFIVMSDDIDYTRRHIVGKHVVFVPPTLSPVVNLAIASLCDHAIITFGTFSFWVAWFANGITITQANHPTPNSTLSHRMKRDDFYKPEWLAM